MHKKTAESGNRRPTIGLLVDWLEDQYQTTILSGTADAAEANDANLLCFVGGRLRSPFRFDVQRNALYDLVSEQNVDGLVILTAALSNDVGLEETTRFCQRFHQLPMVSVALTLEGMPSVFVDNQRGLRDAMTHLIDTHGRAASPSSAVHPGTQKPRHAIRSTPRCWPRTGFHWIQSSSPQATFRLKPVPAPYGCCLTTEASSRRQS